MVFVKRCEGLLSNCLLCGRPSRTSQNTQCDRCLDSFDSDLPKLCGMPLANLLGNKDLCSECSKNIKYNLERKRDIGDIQNLKNISE